MTRLSYSRMLRCTSWLLLLVTSLLLPLQLLGHELQANGGASLNAGDQAHGQRKLLKLVLGGSTITATSTSTADVCVTQVVSADSTNVSQAVQEAIVESSASNGGTVSAYYVSNVTLSGNLTAEALITSVATVHALASTSLQGCKILCPPSKRAANFIQRLTARLGIGRCLNRTLHICPMVGSQGYVVANGFAMASATAGGLGVAGVDSNGNALSEATSDVSAYVYSPEGFAYAESASYTEFSVVADVYHVDAGMYACASASATATAQQYVGLENCLVNCKPSNSRRLTSKDKAASSPKVPSCCHVRRVTQCFS